MRRLALVLATLVALVAASPARAAAAPAAVTYRPPVDAPIVDPFRPADPNWTAGNRGLEYATTPGTLVGAAAAGEVVFAGPVGDGLHVVVLHDDGLRTSYSFLALVAVKRGDRVVQGQTVGTTQDRFHFGVRAGEAYLDPALLFGGGPPQVYLVPDELRRPQSEADERGGIVRMFGGFISRAITAGSEAVQWAADAGTEAFWATVDDYVDLANGALHYAIENQPGAHLQRFVDAANAWWEARKTCTPESVPAPRLGERRILVRVAGLGSTSKEGAIDLLDARALGYADADDVRFSYAGGTTDENAYGVHDTTQDIRESGRRLRALLARLAEENPGVPIDIVAHSQGGLVARSALTDEGEPTDPRLPVVKSLVTLGTPHFGTPAATGLTMVGHTDSGETLLTAAHLALPDQIDPASTSVRQMAEHSEFIRRLNNRPLPAGIQATSIGAREDVLVPAGRTLLAGAHNVTVSAPTLHDDHGELPGSPQAQREVALALAGMAPTCQSFGDAMADAAVSGLIYATEAGLGGSAWLGAIRIDRMTAHVQITVPRRYDLDPPR
ncbi:MAG TPA: peptidoglycan DD-metalloendopeptidase family protein [Acidimicrobiales bacterium]|nr:peptidoglycan DD-metalloendopeptidase family protein [Acidimicrobiales bacterium]